jgi:transposase-like protein
MAPRRWSVSDKLKMIASANERMAEGESLRSICRSFTIQPNQLRDWKRDVDKLSRSKKNKKSGQRKYKTAWPNWESLPIKFQQGALALFNQLM